MHACMEDMPTSGCSTHTGADPEQTLLHTHVSQSSDHSNCALKTGPKQNSLLTTGHNMPCKHAVVCVSTKQCAQQGTTGSWLTAALCRSNHSNGESCECANGNKHNTTASCWSQPTRTHRHAISGQTPRSTQPGTAPGGATRRTQ